MDNTSLFRDLILPFLGEATYLLYAPVCRSWHAAFGRKVTHPRHVVQDLKTYRHHQEDILAIDRPVFVARYCRDDRLLVLFGGGCRRLAKEAVMKGNLKSAFWFGVEQDVTSMAIQHGLLDLKLLTNSRNPLVFSKDIGTGGRVEYLEWMAGHGLLDSRVVEHVTVEAIKAGHVHVLQWFSDRGYDWNVRIVADLCRHPHMLDYLLSHGHDVHDLIVSDFARYNNQPLARHLYERCGLAPLRWQLNTAAEAGHVTMVRLLMSYGCPTDGAIQAAIRGGHIGVVRMLIDAGVPITRDDMLHTLYYGSIQRKPFRGAIMKLLHAERPIPLDSMFLMEAIRIWSMPAIKWLRCKGVAYPRNAAAAAICETVLHREKGQPFDMKLLNYLRNDGCAMVVHPDVWFPSWVTQETVQELLEKVNGS